MWFAFVLLLADWGLSSRLVSRFTAFNGRHTFLGIRRLPSLALLASGAFQLVNVCVGKHHQYQHVPEHFTRVIIFDARRATSRLTKRHCTPHVHIEHNEVDARRVDAFPESPDIRHQSACVLIIHPIIGHRFQHGGALVYLSLRARVIHRPFRFTPFTISCKLCSKSFGIINLVMERQCTHTALLLSNIIGGTIDRRNLQQHLRAFVVSLTLFHKLFKFFLASILTHNTDN